MKIYTFLLNCTFRFYRMQFWRKYDSEMGRFQNWLLRKSNKELFAVHAVSETEGKNA